MSRPAKPRPLELYTDGSGDARVGRPGGWAFVVVDDDQVRATGHGGSVRTTCLVMELEAARAALAEIIARRWHEERAVVLVSDSRIALDIAAGRFKPKPSRYHALADALRAAAIKTGAAGQWVRAHSGHRWNEQVDALASHAKLAVQGVALRD